MKAGEEYTAEMAELRTGDTLVVTIKHASDQGPPQLEDDRRFAAGER